MVKKLQFIMFFLMCVEFSPVLAMGDLMLSVKQRVAIDIARENGVKAVGIEVVPDKVKMNGFFFNNRDNKEQAIVWVNGKQIEDQSITNGVKFKKINERDKTVSLMLDKTRSSIAIKAGQILLLNNGEIIDSFQE